jgi:hypothetical protein
MPLFLNDLLMILISFSVFVKLPDFYLFLLTCSVM